MLIRNDKSDENTHVKFVSYTGAYPNLCSGELTLEIDGDEYKFGHNYSGRGWEHDGNFGSFWSSGGSCGFTDNYAESYVNDGEWIIDADGIPDQFRKYASEIDRVFNENIPYGCCGGCL